MKKIFVILSSAALPLLVLLYTGCKHEQAPNPLAGIPDEMLLNIPTYDGSGQGVHPDIMLLDKPINGKRFMMVFTPYPFYNARLENPSILLSANGVDFTEPVAGINPLVPAPAYDHNDDPDILFDKGRQLYYLHYLQTMRPDSENIIRLESSDAIHWTPHTAVHFDLPKGDPFIVCPAFTQQFDGTYRCWYVSLSDPSGIYTIQTLHSDDGLQWDKSQAKNISQDITPPWVPWHLDVIKNGNQYIMICCCRSPETNSQNETLMIGTSTDGLSWHFSAKPLMVSDPNFHNCSSLYRSTALIYANTLLVYYSMDDFNNEWRIGLKKFALDTVL